MRDDVGMRCEVVRETLSALLDGERQYVPTQRVDAHLESCQDCRSWLVGAAAQARRLASVEPGRGPDLSEQILEAAGVTAIARERRRPRWLALGYRRAALIAV